ncbi:dynamin family protein [Moniliophthora roreri]|nr:dynamin family protein [Moniliophthora roreri]
MSSGISTTSYASRRKELLALVNQLRAVGAQGDLDLPRITIIGNQSAGKSSVVEAISRVSGNSFAAVTFLLTHSHNVQISLPRDAGTCTRCPIDCRLSSTSSGWSCRISIREEYDEQGKGLDEIKEIPFGGVIIDKSEVERALRRAQFAVLNPKIRRKAILSSTLEQLPSLITSTSTKTNSFSRNIVCVDLEGPDLTDFSFIDLPGLIQNAPEEETIALVEDLVLSHVEGNCLILVALPMTDDIENQKALRLARQVDPTGKRTIGVMTKPDMLGPGSKKALELWLGVIEGLPMDTIALVSPMMRSEVS